MATAIGFWGRAVPSRFRRRFLARARAQPVKHPPQGQLRKIGRSYQAQIADISSHLQESFNGLRVVKAFATEDLEKDKFRQASNKLVRIGIKGKIYNQRVMPM